MYITMMFFEDFGAKVKFFCQLVNSLYLCIVELQRKINKINEMSSVTKSLS